MSEVKKYAVLENNIVIEILDLTDEEVVKEASYHEAVILIDDMIPQPEVGWLLVGNKLESNSVSMTQDQKDLFQQKAQRKFGLYILPIAVDQIGARNLKLAREGIPADVATLAAQMASIKVLLEGGALKTVRGLCAGIKPMHPNHSDILDFVISEITVFLNNNGWN